MNAKNLICLYCECNGTSTGKCSACELNPAHGINFQLGKGARQAIEAGVMTETGALKMVLEANRERYDFFNGLFEETAERSADEDDDQ